MRASGFWDALDLEPSVTNFIFLGEAGSGKSEIAINFASLLLERGGREVHLFDLDMTKPLFRSRDSREAVEALGVRLHFEEQFMDAPTAAGGVKRLLRDETCYTVLDVGGDSIGARAVGGYAPLLNSPGAAVYYVINPFRPWSGSMERIDRVLGEILGVSHVRLDRLRLAANPSLGLQTTAADVRLGMRSLMETVVPYKNLDFFCAMEALAGETAWDFPYPLLPLRLYLTYPWNTGGETPV